LRPDSRPSPLQLRRKRYAAGAAAGAAHGDQDTLLLPIAEIGALNAPNLHMDCRVKPGNDD